MAKRTCESYEGCCGRGWIYDSADSGSGRTCYCDCAAGDRLRIEDDDPDLDRRLVEDLAAAHGYRSVDEFNDALIFDNSESIHDRSERRADEVLRYDGSERGRR